MSMVWDTNTICQVIKLIYSRIPWGARETRIKIDWKGKWGKLGFNEWIGRTLKFSKWWRRRGNWGRTKIEKIGYFKKWKENIKKIIKIIKTRGTSIRDWKTLKNK